MTETAIVPAERILDGLAFGVEAERRLATLSQAPIAGARLIVVDASRSGEALAAAVEVKMRGERLLLALALPEPRLLIARVAVASLVAQVAEDDHRRALLDQVADGTIRDASGTPLSEVTVYGEPVIRTLTALIRLADDLVVGSRTEYERIARLLSYRHPKPSIVPGLDRSITSVEPCVDKEVVVWGPHRSAKDLTIFAYALADLHVPWKIVCRDTSEANLPVVYVGDAEGAAVLARASVVIDTELNSPATALALSGHGVQVAVDTTTGTHEHVRNVATYDGASRRSILEAARVALGSPKVYANPNANVVTERPRVKSVLTGPRVSIVIPTRPERRAFFDRALASVRAQIYSNIEVIVFDLSRSGSVPREAWPISSRLRVDSGAYNEIVERIDSEYFGILYDDDLLFPNHVALLVDALERSRAGAVWSDLLVRYLQRLSETEFGVVGYGLWNGTHQPFDRVSILGQCTLGNMVPCMMRREMFVELGGFDYTFALFGDWDLCIRLMQAGEFVYVPRVTAQYSRFLDNTNKGTQDWAGALADTQLVFEKHPTTDRFTVAQKRAMVLQAHSSSVRPREVPPIPYASSRLSLQR